MASPTAEDLSSRIETIGLWDMQLDELDYFALLGVEATDGTSACEQAFHRFALQFHPDCYPEVDASIRNTLTRIFQRGVEARCVLCDPALRARYRASLDRGEMRLLDDAPVVSVDLDQELPKLHESCRSAGAKLEAMAAARALLSKNPQRAKERLLLALAFDGGANPLVQHFIAAIDQALVGDQDP